MILVNNLKARKFKDKFFKYLFLSCIVFCLLFLLILLSGIFSTGIKWISMKFLTSTPSRIPSRAGFLPAIVGSFYLIGTIGLITVPIGVGSAIYLEQYSNKKSWFYSFLEINISNLAGVPAIVYGLLGLAIFSRIHSIRGSVLSGALVLSLMILPVIIVSAREAVKAVPSILIEAAYGLGMTKWQLIKAVVIPYAAPGMLTGIILSLSRAIGESAPLLVVGAASMVTKLPSSLLSKYTAMPIQIFQWSSYPKKDFQDLAAAGIMVLLFFLLSANSVAIILRNKYQKERE
ncbi:MAG: phosphate ABC transporter permease PstA [Leptotrichiaceae bacterium]